MDDRSSSQFEANLLQSLPNFPSGKFQDYILQQFVTGLWRILHLNISRTVSLLVSYLLRVSTTGIESRREREAGQVANTKDEKII